MIPKRAYSSLSVEEIRILAYMTTFLGLEYKKLLAFDLFVQKQLIQSLLGADIF